jgi:hypothetical protein
MAESGLQLAISPQIEFYTRYARYLDSNSNLSRLMKSYSSAVSSILGTNWHLCDTKHAGYQMKRVNGPAILRLRDQQEAPILVHPDPSGTYPPWVV